MLLIIYNIISILLLIPLCLFHIYQCIKGVAPPFLERFGCLPDNVVEKIRNRQVIWLHAVSVGEVLAARPLMKEMRKRYPKQAILISVSTKTGYNLASTFSEQEICIYFPFDFLPSVRHVLNTVAPQLIIIMETEIWPNFTNEASRMGIPLILINGRISDRSLNNYLHLRWFFCQALQCFSSLCMQTENDRERIVAIGAIPEQVFVSGNLKYDIPFREVAAEERISLRHLYGLPSDAFILVAGSTRTGEDQQIIDVYRALLIKYANIFLVIVPRHPQRAGDIESLAKQSGLVVLRRTSFPDGCPSYQQPGEVFLVDTIGELMKMYLLADIVFVGGSLVPKGGHNLLEPASFGVPSLFGQYTTNFREATALVLKYEAGIRVDSAVALTEACLKLIDNEAERRRLGKNGLRMLSENGGATERHLEVIGRYL